MGQFSEGGQESLAKIIEIAPNEEDTTRQRSWGKNTTGRRYSKYKSCQGCSNGQSSGEESERPEPGQRP